jgi:hypothetical protein
MMMSTFWVHDHLDYRIPNASCHCHAHERVWHVDSPNSEYCDCKIGPIEDDIHVSSGPENNVCTVVDIFDKTTFYFLSTTPNPSKCQ